MLSGYEIIVFSDEWGRHPFSCQHIMKHFIATNRIIWVTPTGMRNPKLSFHDLKRATEKIKKWRSSSNRMVTEPLQISPVALPFNTIMPIRALNNFIVKLEVNKKLTEGLKRIVITTLPITAEYADCFRADVIVYYIVDDYAELPGVNSALIQYLEDKLIARSDVLLASSNKLCDIKACDKDVTLISHGVDYEHFYCDMPDALDNDERFGKRQRPIIGFFGAISPWIDFDLIATAAMAHRDWSFVLIGPVDANIRALADCTNVHMLGKIPYEELPRYARQFDVGIIPFLINDLTASVSPLKLLEYFACGLPVVSTALPEVNRFRDYLYVARDPVDFIRCLEEAVGDHDRPVCREERQRVARANSWRSIAEHFGNEIEAFLKRNETSHTHNH